jgi:DNA-binding NtrC family response regulator
LLRVLQDNRFYPVGSTKEVQVDIRVICATNRNLPQRIAEGAFREDLYYRINVIPLEMPSLRRRREDIPGLIAHFVAVHGPRVNSITRNITPKAMAELTTYDWPGNIRELGNTVERMLVLYGRDDTITEEHVASLLPNRELRKNRSPELDEALEQFQGLPIEQATAQMERYLIETAMERAGNVQSRAAELLGTTRRKLKYKMDQLGIASE